MSNIIGIGYTYAEFFIVILLVIFVYLISRFINMPFYFDPFGEKSVRLTKRLNPFSRLSSHILSLLTFGKFKLLTSQDWRIVKINEVAEREIGEFLELKIVTGGFRYGLRKTVRLALIKGYKVVLLSGLPYCDTVADMKEFLNYPKFELYIGKKRRPKKHFAIIGETNIFLEAPHLPYNQEKEYSLGIRNAKPEIVKLYTERFNKMKEGMQKITSIEEIEEMMEYCIIPPQKGKLWGQFGS